GTAAPLATTSSLTMTSGKMPASSQASSALSTASLTQVSSALRGLSKPSRWRFLVKNSETEISRWRAPISTAETVARGSAAGAAAGDESAFGMALDIFSFHISMKRKSGTNAAGPRNEPGQKHHHLLCFKQKTAYEMSTPKTSRLYQNPKCFVAFPGTLQKKKR